jgi:hypothetical protein
MDSKLTILFVHEKSTQKTERYAEVTPGREREVMRTVYFEREALKTLVQSGQDFPPQVIEISVRRVDPRELRES